MNFRQAVWAAAERRRHGAVVGWRYPGEVGGAVTKESMGWMGMVDG